MFESSDKLKGYKTTSISSMSMDLFESSDILKGYKYYYIQYYFLFLPFYLKCGRIQIYMEILYINKIIEVK